MTGLCCVHRNVQTCVRQNNNRQHCY